MDGKALAETVRDTRTVNYVLMACSSLMIYDMVLTLKDEVEYLRASRWTLMKYTYVALRLSALITLNVFLYVWTTPALPHHICKFYLRFTSYGVTFPIYMGQALLLLRICALHHGNRKVIWTSIALYSCEIALLTALVVHEIRTNTLALVLPGSPIPGCMIVGISGSRNIGISFNTFDLLVSTLFFVLTILKFFRSVKMAPASSGTGRGMADFEDAQRLMPVMFLFFRDGSVYYLAVLASQIFFVIFTNAPGLVDGPFVLVGAPVTIAAYTIATSRLLYSMRRQLTEEVPEQMMELGALPRESIIFRHTISDT